MEGFFITSYTYKTQSVCVCVCQFSVPYAQPRFQRISTKFGMWYPYTAEMVMSVEGLGVPPNFADAVRGRGTEWAGAILTGSADLGGGGEGGGRAGVLEVGGLRAEPLVIHIFPR